MNTLVLYCHPSELSHNFRILQEVKRGLEEAGMQYEVIDLYRLPWNPVLDASEYERMMVRRDRTVEEDVAAVQSKIARAHTLIFIYPVWWYSMPAMLKGFLDRVFTAGFAYRFRRAPRWMMWGANILSYFPGIRYLLQPYSAKGLLKGKRAYIFRTYGGPPLGRRMFGNTVTILEHAVLRFCGITNIRIRELYGINAPHFTHRKEQRYLDEVRRVVRG